MRSIHSTLCRIAPFIFFPLLILTRKNRKVVYLFGIFIVISLSSCFLNFYQTNTKHSVDANAASGLVSQNKYFIIHFKNSTDGLENARVHNDSLFGKIVTIPAEHLNYLHPDTANKKNRVKAKDKKDALIEVHLYTDAQLKNTDSVWATALSSFNRIDVYELNKSATNENHFLSYTGVVIAAFIVTVSILFAVECNCPQVYMDNTFVSGLYSGAVYSTLERTDYLPLNTVPYNANGISFTIANAKSEEQFINKVQLLQVDHSKDVQVLADRHGNIFSYTKPVAPIAALTDERNDVIQTLNTTDEQYYSFTNNANEDGFSDVRLQFNKPENADKVKLIIHARNSYWGGLLHKEFLGMFGDDFEKWRAKQEKADPKELEQWQKDQALPLMVYVKTKQGWKYVDYYQIIGNTASRDMIMQIDTKDIAGDKLELKLETAYRFWDLDYAAIDYSNEAPITATVVEPTQAITSDSTDERANLSASDKLYVHLTGDENISFSYSATAPKGNMERSYFLVSGGYYHTAQPATGKADYTELMKFKKAGAFDQFSREKYKQAQDVAAIFNSIKN